MDDADEEICWARVLRFVRSNVASSSSLDTSDRDWIVVISSANGASSLPLERLRLAGWEPADQQLQEYNDSTLVRGKNIFCPHLVVRDLGPQNVESLLELLVLLAEHSDLLLYCGQSLCLALEILDVQGLSQTERSLGLAVLRCPLLGGLHRLPVGGKELIRL
jgi:hypothetical protein